MTRFWVAVGPESSWDVSLEQGVWVLNGYGRGPYYHWEVSVGDHLLFYVTAPVSGVVGSGRITGKTGGGKPIWPAELKARKVLWPLRMTFDIERLIPKPLWTAKKVTSVELKNRVQGGFQHISARLASELLEQL